MQDAVLTAFLIIDDKLQRDASLARPRGLRPAAAIADQIARIILPNVKQAAELPTFIETLHPWRPSHALYTTVRQNCLQNIIRLLTIMRRARLIRPRPATGWSRNVGRWLIQRR